MKKLQPDEKSNPPFNQNLVNYEVRKFLDSRRKSQPNFFTAEQIEDAIKPDIEAKCTPRAGGGCRDEIDSNLFTMIMSALRKIQDDGKLHIAEFGGIEYFATSPIISETPKDMEASHKQELYQGYLIDDLAVEQFIVDSFTHPDGTYTLVPHKDRRFLIRVYVAHRPKLRKS